MSEHSASTPSAEAPALPAAPARGKLVATLALVAAAVAGAVYLLHRDAFIDDAFIAFRYARSLAAHGELAYHAGERLEGITSLAWVATLALFRDIPAAAKLLGALLFGASLLLGMWLYERQRGAGASTFPVLLVPLLLATEFSYSYFANAGMEIAPAACALLGAAALATRPARRATLLLPPLFALAFLLRPESVLVLPLFFALALPRGALRWREGLLLAAATALLLVAITALRWRYFGQPLPNTFFAKPASGAQALLNLLQLLRGNAVNVPFPFSGPLGVLLLVGSAHVLFRAGHRAGLMLLAIWLAGLLFAVYSPPDWTEQARYFAPYYPAAVVALLLALYALLAARHVAHRPRRLVGVALLAVVAINAVDLLVQRARAAAYPHYVMFGRTLVPAAQWLREHLPPAAGIATRRIGVVGFVTGRPIFDYRFGLVDRDVTRLIQRSGLRPELPTDPRLWALWRARAPEAILEDGDVLAQIGGRGLGDRFVVHGLRYRVARRFPIGTTARWTLALRDDLAAARRPRPAGGAEAAR